MSDDLVTGGEFGRWRADFQAFQARLDSRLDRDFGALNERLDELNGRTRKNSEAIVALDTRVSTIAASGCGQLQAHRAAFDALPVESRKTWRDWHPAAKVGAGVGGSAALVALIELVNRVLQHFGV